MPPIPVSIFATLQPADLKVVAFLVGRALAYLRPGFYMRYALQSGTSLSTWFLAGVRRIMTNFPVPPNYVQPVSDAVEVLWRQLDRPATDKLGDQVAAFLSSVGGGLDLKRWGYAVDLTADRAGLIVCNNIGERAPVLAEFHPGFAEVDRDLGAAGTPQ